MATTISVLGCGWLGMPLAKNLLSNYTVNGSTTTASKIPILEAMGIASFLIDLPYTKAPDNLLTFLGNAEQLVINIPPKLRNNGTENYVSKIESLLSYIAQSNIKHVLFISSTSVYGDTNSIVTENTALEPTTESGKQLVAVEQLLQNNSAFLTTVVRFGGLIGKDRHPVYFLAGKQSIENPEGPVNLIQQDDCIAIILKILATKAVWGAIYNAVAPFHPTRKAYYTQKATALHLDPPVFKETASNGKIISSAKLIHALHYTFSTI